MDHQNLSKKTIADPRSRYGDGKEATRQFIVQRITGGINIVFTVFMVWLVTQLAGDNRADAVALVGNPFVGLILAVLMVSVFAHMRIGMIEIIEDYFHTERNHRLTKLLNTGYVVLIAAVVMVSIAKLVFWG